MADDDDTFSEFQVQLDRAVGGESLGAAEADAGGAAGDQCGAPVERARVGVRHGGTVVEQPSGVLGAPMWMWARR